MAENRWDKFYEATNDREPRELFLEGLSNVPEKLPKVAIDIGFGAGNETRALLEKGWEVTAIDYEETAANYLREKIPETSTIKIVTASYEEVNYHPASFIHAGFSLPFCPPNHFDRVWLSISNAVTPKGIFCGQLFGENDAWSDKENMKFHTRSEVEKLLKQFDIIKLEETEGIRQTATGKDKYWHYYDIIARKTTS